MRFSPEFEPDERFPDGRSLTPEEALEEDFPLGDGTADLEASAACPYCCEPVTLALDPGSGAAQEYVEDCPVCCQPWQVSVRYGAEGRAAVSLDVL